MVVPLSVCAPWTPEEWSDESILQSDHSGHVLVLLLRNKKTQEFIVRKNRPAMPAEAGPKAQSGLARHQARYERDLEQLKRFSGRKGVVQLVHIGPENQFFTMRYAGRSLSTILDESGEPLRPGEALRVVADTAAILALFHDGSSGGVALVHNDIKPSNIALDDHGRITVLDLGLCSPEGELVRDGTLPYTCPEAFEKKPTSPARDIWALGCVLHELVTGELLFMDPDLREIARQIRAWDGYDQARLRVVSPDPLLSFIAELLRRCLEPRPEDRITALELTQMIVRRIVEKTDVLPSTPPPAAVLVEEEALSTEPASAPVPARIKPLGPEHAPSLTRIGATGLLLLITGWAEGLSLMFYVVCVLWVLYIITFMLVQHARYRTVPASEA